MHILPQLKKNLFLVALTTLSSHREVATVLDSADRDDFRQRRKFHPTPMLRWKCSFRGLLSSLGLVGGVHVGRNVPCSSQRAWGFGGQEHVPASKPCFELCRKWAKKASLGNRLCLWPQRNHPSRDKVAGSLGREGWSWRSRPDTEGPKSGAIMKSWVVRCQEKECVTAAGERQSGVQPSVDKFSCIK